LVITSHMSETSKAAVAHLRSPFRLFDPLFCLISLVIPATAWSDIYKWTDEQGRTCFSNIPPPESRKVKNVEIVLKETTPATKAPTSIPEHVATPTELALLARVKSLERQLQPPQYAAQATPTEQALLARINNLERQVQAQQYAAQAPAVPPPTFYSGYYPSTPPPPPPPNYYDAGYNSSYYPSYYPSYYYPAVASYSYVAYPARTFISRPVFVAPRGGSFYGGGHRGRR
jgi:hypothetical protein